MAQRPILHIEVPNIEVSRPITPGANSWATLAAPNESSVRQPSKHAQPTNRSKYENKAMPPLPVDRNRPAIGESKRNQARAFIDPFVDDRLSHLAQSYAYRDPQDQFGEASSRKSSGASEDRESLQGIFQSPIQRQDPERLASASPPASYRAHHSAPCFNGGRSEDKDATPMNPKRQANSTPVPVQQVPRDDGDPATTLDFTSAAAMLHSARQCYPQSQSNADQQKGIILGNGALHPLTSMTGKVVGGEDVQSEQRRKMKSYVGVIEGSEYHNAANLPELGFPRPPSPESVVHRGEKPTATLVPSGHMPEGYQGISQHSPHVVHSLHPFSPFQMQRSDQSLGRNLSQASPRTVPFGFDEYQYQSSGLRNEVPASNLANSWASSPSRTVAETPGKDPPLSAIVPPLFAQRSWGTAVPTPPHSTYQPHMGLPSAELSRLELNMHHHIDTAFASLTRLMINKQDQTVDQIVRRVEAVEAKVEKSVKLLKEVKEMVDVSRAGTSKALNDVHRLLEVQAAKADEIAEILRPAHSQRYGENGEADQILRPRPQRSQSVLVSPTHRAPSQAHKASNSDATTRGMMEAEGLDASERRVVGHAQGRVSSKDIIAGMHLPLHSPPDIRNHPALRGSHKATHKDSVGSPTRAGNGIEPFSAFSDFGGSRWYNEAFGG